MLGLVRAAYRHSEGRPPESLACQVPPSISFPGNKCGNTLRAVQRRSRGVRSLCQAWRVRPWCPGLAALESGHLPEQDGPLVGPRPHPPSSSPRDPGCPPPPSQCPPLTDCSPQWSTVAATAHPGWGWAPIPAPFRGNLEKAFKCRLSLSTHACALLSATSGLWGVVPRRTHLPEPPLPSAPAAPPSLDAWTQGGAPSLRPLLLTISLKPTVPRGLGLRQGGCPLTGAQGAALNPQTDPREPRLGGPSRCWLFPCSPPGSPPLEGGDPHPALPCGSGPPPHPEPTGLACALDVQIWAQRLGR